MSAAGSPRRRIFELYKVLRGAFAERAYDFPAAVQSGGVMPGYQRDMNTRDLLTTAYRQRPGLKAAEASSPFHRQ